MRTRLKELREDNDLTQLECAKIGYISKTPTLDTKKAREFPRLI